MFTAPLRLLALRGSLAHGCFQGNGLVNPLEHVALTDDEAFAHLGSRQFAFLDQAKDFLGAHAHFLCCLSHIERVFRGQ